MNSLSTYCLTARLLSVLRRAVEDRGFLEILPSMLSNLMEPGARHSVAVLGEGRVPEIRRSPNGDDAGSRVAVFGKSSYFISVSNLIERQYALEFVDRVYCLAPCLRLLVGDDSSSGNHLYNFHQFEIEVRDAKSIEMFTIVEDLLATVARQLPNSSFDLELDEKCLQTLCLTPYPRMTFRDALRMVNADTAQPKDFSAEQTRSLSLQFDRPFLIYDYPEKIRDSLYHQTERGTFDTFDLMLPFGFGELLTGGVRPTSAAEISRHSQSLAGETNLEYAEWKERTGVNSAGFAIGLERLVKFCCGAENIFEVRPFHDRGPNAGIGEIE